MELILSCKCLPNRGSAVYCRILSLKNEDWSEIFRTEEHSNATEPEWNSTAVLNPSENYLRFEIHSKHSLISCTEIEVAELATNKSNYMWLDPFGMLFVYVVSLSQDLSLIHLTLAAHDLKCRFSDVYIKIYRHIEHDRFIEVYRTAPVKSQKSAWNEFSLTVQDMCNSDPDKPIRLALYSTNVFKPTVLLGEVCVSLNALMQSGKSYEIGSFGRIEICSKIEQKFYFEDFIASGFELSLINAIDYSSSNKDPSSADSLHYSSPEHMSAYQKCFMDIHTCLSWQWPINRLGLLGFGGECNRNKDCFSLTDNDNTPWVLDIQNLIKAYQNSLKSVVFSGPTNLHFTLRRTIKIAQKSMTKKNYEYFALCVLSDGDFSDIPEIEEALEEIPDLPISVIVFGIGISRCGALEYLDRQVRRRKCFKFIPVFTYFAGDSIISIVEEHFMSYVRFKGIIPRKISTQVRSMLVNKL